MDAYKTVLLLAEDDEGHFALIKKNLARLDADCRIVHFFNGRELLDFLYGRLSTQMLADRSYLLLLDIKMPGIDGVEVLRRIKSDPKLEKLPVIMLTTTGEPSQVDACYELGCSFYIVKPSDYSEFRKCVEAIGWLLFCNDTVMPVFSTDS